MWFKEKLQLHVFEDLTQTHKITTCNASKVVIFSIFYWKTPSSPFIWVMMKHFFLIYRNKQHTDLECKPAANLLISDTKMHSKLTTKNSLKTKIIILLNNNNNSVFQLLYQGTVTEKCWCRSISAPRDAEMLLLSIKLILVSWWW